MTSQPGCSVFSSSNGRLALNLTTLWESWESPELWLYSDLPEACTCACLDKQRCQRLGTASVVCIEVCISVNKVCTHGWWSLEASKPRRRWGGQSCPLSPAFAIATDASARWGICFGNMFCPTRWQTIHKATFHNFFAWVWDSVPSTQVSVSLSFSRGLDFQNLACTFHEFPAAMLPSVRTWRHRKRPDSALRHFMHFLSLWNKAAQICSRHVLPLEPLCCKRTQLWSTAFVCLVAVRLRLEPLWAAANLQGHERPQCAGDWASCCNASRHKEMLKQLFLELVRIWTIQEKIKDDERIELVRSFRFCLGSKAWQHGFCRLCWTFPSLSFPCTMLKLKCSFFYIFSGSKFCFTFSRLELSGPPWVPKGTGLGSWTDSALAHSSHNQLVDVWLCDSYFFTHTHIYIYTRYYTRIILYSTYCTIRHIIRRIILTFPKWCSAEFPAGKSEALEFLSTGYGWCLQGKVSWSSSALT